jgi:hypothetical protein
LEFFSGVSISAEDRMENHMTGLFLCRRGRSLKGVFKLALCLRWYFISLIKAELEEEIWWIRLT